MRVQIQQGREVSEVEIEGDACSVQVDDLMGRIEEDLGVFRRKQRLILKGKVLQAHQTLAQAKVSDRVKIMLIASTTRTLGSIESEKLEKSKEAARLAKTKKPFIGNAATRDSLQDRALMWRKTGIVILREAAVKEIPREVWTSAANCQSVDLKSNSIASLPSDLSQLTQLTRLNLSNNLLTSEGSSALSTLTQLKMLSMRHNKLTGLELLKPLGKLQSLDLGGNQITSVSNSISSLSSLQNLGIDRNVITEVSPELGLLSSLMYLDLTDNKISALPGELGHLDNLQVLIVEKNRLCNLPKEILESCSSLHTINVHDNPMSVEDLRQSAGFAEFDSRRKTKYTKQIMMDILNSKTGFDEGADVR